MLQSGTNNFAGRKAMALTNGISLQSQCIVNWHPSSLHTSLLTEESGVTVWLQNMQNEVSLSAPVRANEIKKLGMCRSAVSDLPSITVRTLHSPFLTPASYKKHRHL